MAKKIIIGLFFSLLLTWIFWRITGSLALNRVIDNVVFAGSPVLAVIISVLLVRSKLMASSQTDED